MECCGSGCDFLPKICAILLVLLVGVCSSSFISDEGLRSQASTGRHLLQAKKGCSVDFEYKNYTIITSRCKGPHYSADVCCKAFKEFACPYAEAINDLNTDCASTMFSYINLNGNYPPGLFANECREGKLGLECTAIAPGSSTNNSSSQLVSVPSLLRILTAGILVLFFHNS